MRKSLQICNGVNDKRVLILGGSSYIGRHLFKRLGPHKAIATYCRNQIEGAVYFDALSMRLEEIVNDPSLILYTVILLGDTNPETCAAEKAKSRALNVDSIKSILTDLKKWRIKPIFTSSEFVFDGTKGRYVESDTARPILTYGWQKLEIEEYIRDNFDEFVIFRLAKVFGSQPGDGTIFLNWLARIEQGEEVIPCAADQIFSPIYIDDVVEGIIRSMETDARGIFHLAGKRPYARSELLEMLLSYVNAHRAVKIKVIPKSINDFNLLEKRPLNVSMNPSKIVKTLGLKLTETEDVCRGLVKSIFQNCPYLR